MVYKWKVEGLYKIPAQKAGEELEKLYFEDGKISPHILVEKSRPQTAPLHGCFEWRDDIAAEKYRCVQAQKLICAIVTVEEFSTDNTPIEVRAFLHTEKEYHPINIIMRDEEKKYEILRTAYRELKAFQRKYGDLKEFSSIFCEIDKLKIME